VKAPLSPSSLLETRGVSKLFGDAVAIEDVSIKARPGEIHAILGENGAGKSTLVKLMYGVLQPSAGQIFWQGAPQQIVSPNHARKLGIGMVFQHFSLFEALTVVENVALTDSAAFDINRLSARIADVSHAYGLPIMPRATVADLSVGERQRIEIVRCLLSSPKLLILDEPTAVLTPQEADQLFATLNRLSAEGCSIFYITHRLEEVQRLCSRATVLRHGRVVAECDPRVETAASMARLMIGSKLEPLRAPTTVSASTPRLVVSNLTMPKTGPFSTALKDVSLTVNGGEVLAIAGVAGNGQSELFDVVSGERRAGRADAVVIDNHKSGRDSIAARRKRGAGFVPEERMGHGSVPPMRLSENTVLTRHHEADAVKSKVINRTYSHGVAKRVAASFDIRKNSSDPEARTLSGGNLQKFVIGRELERKPGVLVVNQPTWGVDAGAAKIVRQALVDLAREGSAVLVISQDLDEVFEIADRIAVLSRGRLSEPKPIAEMTPETIGLLMAGAHEAPRGVHASHS
jgi:general nucleoside transport system ATP-binding protein